MTKRIDVMPAPAPLEEYAEHFDVFFGKSNQREGCAPLCRRSAVADRAA